MDEIFPTPRAVQAELEALREQRRVLDEAIAERERFLELGRRLAAGRSTPSEPSEPARSLDEASGAHGPAAAGFAGLTPVSAARARGRQLADEALAILADQGRPMHAAELMATLAQRGFALPGSDPVASLNTRLWKRAKGQGPLVRHGDAVYGLRGAPHATEG